MIIELIVLAALMLFCMMAGGAIALYAFDCGFRAGQGIPPRPSRPKKVKVDTDPGEFEMLKQRDDMYRKLTPPEDIEDEDDNDE